MEKLAEVLLRLESKDAVNVASKYITFKYVELFMVTFILIAIVVGGGFIIRHYIKNVL